MKKLMIAAFAALAAFGAMAWSPIGIGIVAPVQFPYTSSDVYGIRFGGLFGLNENVYGIDLGLAEVATGNEGGIQGGLFNVVWGDAMCIQGAGAINYNAASFGGLQVAGLCNWNGLTTYGLQCSTVNANQTELYGFSFGALNYSASLSGAQFGAINMADSVTGLQIGLINVCDKMKGIQIGGINMITTSPLPVMVFANAWF